MSIADTISSMENNLSNAYDSVNAKGGTLPANKNLQNLSNSISSIPSGGGAELPNIESVKCSNTWYVTDFTYPVDDIDVNNMVMLDNKLYYFDGADHFVYEDGQWQQYVRGTVFDDNSIYGKDLFVMNGLQYLVFTDTNNDVGNYIYKTPYFYVVQYNSANIPSDGTKVWSRNGHYYYSDSTTQWEFDPSNNEWNTRTWGNVNDFDGDNIWTDGFEYYYSDGTVNYVLDDTNWVQKTWNYNVVGKDIWTDGKNIYYSNNGVNKKLVDGEWVNNDWEYTTDVITEGAINTYTSNAYGRAIIQWGNGIYAHVNRIDLTDENNPETYTYWVTNKSKGTFETSLDTMRVGDLNKQNNEEAFTVGNINNALEILNNGNIGGGGVLITKYIDQNGVYDAIDDGASGYSSVEVSVSGGGGGGDGILDGSTTSLYNDTVTQLREYALYGFFNLQSVEMPNVTDVGYGAFSQCVGLTDANFASLVETGEGMFESCSNLTNITMPNLQIIGNGTFSNCFGLTSFDFSNIQVVGENAFQGCENLATFTNLGDVQEIRPYAFSGNQNITSLSLANTTSVSGFNDCMNLTSIDLPSATTIGDFAFVNCPLSSITLGSGLESIGESAFEGQQNLPSLNLSSVLSFGGGSFRNTNLTGALTLTNVQVIGSGAFADTTITSLGNTSNLTEIGMEAFMNTSITTITAPNIVSVADRAFANMPSLNYVTLSNSANYDQDSVYLGDGMFADSPIMTLELPASVDAYVLGGDPFGSCPFADDTITGSYGTIHVTFDGLSAWQQKLNDLGLSQYIPRLVNDL